MGGAVCAVTWSADPALETAAEARGHVNPGPEVRLRPHSAGALLPAIAVSGGGVEVWGNPSSQAKLLFRQVEVAEGDYVAALVERLRPFRPRNGVRRVGRRGSWSAWLTQQAAPAGAE
jgi:hypothetical protein